MVIEYIHIKNIEKYHPGYKDRKLQWAKIYFTMVNGDPEFEVIDNEIDKWRFIAMVCLELNAQKPLLNSDKYWKKHFDLKKRAMSLTLRMLHNFITTVKKCNVDKEEDKEKEEEKKPVTGTPPPDFLTSLKNNPAYASIDLERELAKMDAWLLTRPGRKKTKRFIINWLNKIDVPVAPVIKKPPEPPPPEPINEAERERVRQMIHQTARQLRAGE